MRKYILSLAVVAAIITTVNASAQFRYGPMLGMDITTMKFNQKLFNVDSNVGFSAGLATELMFPGIGFGVDAGIFYQQRGATLNLGEREVWASQGYGKERCYLHYIEVPVNLRFKWTRMNGLEDYVAPFVFGGPTFSILAAHSDIKALDYPFGDVGLTAGFGVEIYRDWQVSGSYTWGLMTAASTKLLDDFNSKNRTWNVRVVYFFKSR
ncbi:MAG TPA: porin family protein [Muribaculum sp.]|jgi:hypothetical protein|uniref:Porin family protein n=1 Tax=Heminiphilus faecis TaxID=2601703 RepID=A0ABV4CW55_9BACT|nr:porin family protein [Heminiphilus faecis]HRF68567.1 porin family protein [Muribaculum sp.]